MRLALALSVAVVWPPHAAGAAGTEPLPYTLSVRVVDAGEAGPTGFRRQVERATVRAVRASGCVREVRAFRDTAGADADNDVDVELRVELADLEEEIRFDEGIVERARRPSAGDPGLEATLEVTVSVRLRVSGEGLRRRRFRHTGERRPLGRGEDAIGFLRAQAARAIAGAATKLPCKGSRRKLRRRIERALRTGSGPR